MTIVHRWAAWLKKNCRSRVKLMTTSYLIVTRGAPGAGKSTFLRDKGLARLVINPDNIRVEVSEISADEDYFPDAYTEQKVWKRVYDDVRAELEAGSSVIIDATFQNDRDFKEPVQLHRLFRTKFLCIDFSSVSEATAKLRNAERSGWRRVPDEIVTRAYTRFRTGKISKYIEMVDYRNFEDHPAYSELISSI